MPGKKFLRNVSGEISEVTGTDVSAGAGNSGDIVALDASGRIDSTMMPVGIGADTVLVTASEALSAGDLVNLYNNASVLNARKADASNGREADGFVLVAVASAASATVYKEGTITGLAGLTPGAKLYLGTSGAVTVTPPTTSGHTSQRIGKALSAISADFEAQRTILIA